jgi:predicted nucleotidyltransferase
VAIYDKLNISLIKLNISLIMTKLEKKIIVFLSDYPERDFYGQEIADRVKCSKASASIRLKALAENKIVFVKTKGIMKFYQINSRSLELKKIKIDLVFEKIRPLLLGLEKLSKKIILFGSGSRGEQTAGSDIDIFILGNNKKEIFETISKTKIVSIKAIIKTPSEWSEMEIREPEFFREIKNGLTLYEYVPRI